MFLRYCNHKLKINENEIYLTCLAEIWDPHFNSILDMLIGKTFVKEVLKCTGYTSDYKMTQILYMTDCLIWYFDGRIPLNKKNDLIQMLNVLRFFCSRQTFNLIDNRIEKLKSIN